MEWGETDPKLRMSTIDDYDGLRRLVQTLDDYLVGCVLKSMQVMNTRFDRMSWKVRKREDRTNEITKQLRLHVVSFCLCVCLSRSEVCVCGRVRRKSRAKAQKGGKWGKGGGRDRHFSTHTLDTHSSKEKRNTHGRWKQSPPQRSFSQSVRVWSGSKFCDKKRAGGRRVSGREGEGLAREKKKGLES